LLTENGLTIDQRAIDHVLANADVVTIGFTALAPRLLIDTRADSEHGPLVTIVEPVRNLQERYLWLGRHRGMFPAPRDFTFFVWPHTVRLLRETGALDVVRRRLEILPGGGAHQLDRAIEELTKLERDTFRSAIRGEGPWRTIWAAV